MVETSKRTALTESKSVATPSSIPSKPKSLMSKLKLLKPKQASKPLAPNPFVVRNDMYDEYWATKQERAFTKWLNYEFTNGIQSSSSNAPVSSLSQFSRNMARENIRRAAGLMYQSESIRAVWQKLEPEIENGKFSFKPDCDVTSDLGLRERLTSLILSYHPHWLVLGLEIVLGKTLPEPDMCQLTYVISQHVLSFHAPVDTVDYKSVAHRSFLKKLLMLILFLDKAKLTRLLPGDPCLFCKDSRLKSSRDVLLNLSNFLSGEGDITRHLLFFGYSISQKQTPIDEMDFTVGNLATDLRDGIRLAKIIEIETSDFTIVPSLRYPAPSKQVMLANVTKIFEVLEKNFITLHGVKGGGIEPKDIVDGHREKTLGLLWKIILHWKISMLLALDPLRDEISVLKGDFSKKFGRVFDDEVVEDIYFQSEHLSTLFTWARLVCALHGLPLHNFTSSFGDGRALCTLLSHYHPRILKPEQIKMNEDTFQQPEFLPADGWISYSPRKKPTAESMSEYNFKLFNSKLKELGGVPFLVRGMDAVNSVLDEKVIITTVSYMASRLMVLRKEIRAAMIIQEFFRKIKYRMDYQRRKAAAKKIYEFCSSVIIKKRLSKDFQMRRAAAVYVQRFWRGKLLQKEIDRRIAFKHFQASCRGFLVRREILVQFCAASVIQRAYRSHVERKKSNFDGAVVHVQSLVRGFFERKKFADSRADVVQIQSLVRKYLAFKELQRLKLIVKTQACVRRYLAVKNYAKQKQLIVIVQSMCRAKMATENFRKMKAAIIVAQSAWRMFAARTQYSNAVARIVKVQSMIRRNIAQTRFQNLKKTVNLISEKRQAILLSRKDRLQYQKQVELVVLLQSMIRSKLARNSFKAQVDEVVKIQSVCRSYIERVKYEKSVESVKFLQSLVRAKRQGKVEREKYLSTIDSIVIVQNAIRRHFARKHFAQLRARREQVLDAWTTVYRRHESTIHIQRFYRKHLTYKKAQQKTESVILLQSIWRGYKARKQFKHAKLQQDVRNSAAAIIQNAYRRWMAKKELRAIRKATVTIQSFWRGYIARRTCTRMMREVRERLAIANAQVKEENKIGNRARYALDLLMNSNNLSTVMKACEHLETVTRLSKEWCILIVNHDAVVKLYDFIKTCNRSKPHLEVLKLVVKVLFNLCQYPETADEMFSKPEMNEILLDMLQSYREVDAILNLTLEIIWIECQYEQFSVKLNKNTELKRRLTSVANLLDRQMLTNSKIRTKNLNDGLKASIQLIKRILNTFTIPQ